MLIGQLTFIHFDTYIKSYYIEGYGSPGGNRTHTDISPRDFKSLAPTCYATGPLTCSSVNSFKIRSGYMTKYHIVMKYKFINVWISPAKTKMAKFK
jgi:hypothetical protein